MHSIRSFFRALPPNLCRGFIARHDGELADRIDWNRKETRVRQAVDQAIPGIDTELRQQMQAEIERIMVLADEPGEAAIRSVVANTAALEALPGGPSRALFLFLHRPAPFQRAEEVRFTDERRQGRMWNRVQGPAGKAMEVNTASIEALKASLRERFGWGRIHIEAFERTRIGSADQEYRLLQLAIYRQGWRTQTKEFVGEELRERPHWPVIEAAITYEPESGCVEVVAKEKDVRDQLPALFSSDILNAPIDAGVLLPQLGYDLSGLKRPHDFPVDPEDGIESVRLVMLRLMPVDAPGVRVVLETLSRARETIWEMAERRLRRGNPLRGSWSVTQAQLAIRFHPGPQERRGRTLPIKLTMPNGCDLKDRTARERLIGRKYLARWGLLEKTGGA